MKRPLAYITAHWDDNPGLRTPKTPPNTAAWSTRPDFPSLPLLFTSAVLKDSIPQRHKDGIDMARDYLRRASVLVILRRYGG